MAVTLDLESFALKNHYHAGAPWRYGHVAGVWLSSSCPKSMGTKAFGPLTFPCQLRMALSNIILLMELFNQKTEHFGYLLVATAALSLGGNACSCRGRFWYHC